MGPNAFTQNQNGWTAPQNTGMNQYQYNQQNQQMVSSFVWITNPNVVDMWPIAAGSEMTFIDGDSMTLYVKRVDEYNHPLKTRKFKLTEVVEEEPTNTTPSQPAINMEELKTFISSEIDRSVSNRFSNMFSMPVNNTTSQITPSNRGGEVNV